MFIYSLSAIFAFTDLLSPLKFAALLLLVFGVVYIKTPQSSKNWISTKEKNIYFILRSCWNGEESLWIAFWPFFILANMAFFYIDYRSENLTYTIASWRTVHMMLVFPSIWWLTSVWKCSNNTQKIIWSSCARAITIYFVIDFFLRLYLSFYYPQILFDCLLLAIEYGSC